MKAARLNQPGEALQIIDAPKPGGVKAKTYPLEEINEAIVDALQLKGLHYCAVQP
jgi:hypothetical protein